jgi:hypothetical protein
MIDPRGLRNVIEWADFLTLPLNEIGIRPRRLDHEDDWVNWAFDLIQEPGLQDTVVDPRGFTDWQEWAQRFNQVVQY